MAGSEDRPVTGRTRAPKADVGKVAARNAGPPRAGAPRAGAPRAGARADGEMALGIDLPWEKPEASPPPDHLFRMEHWLDFVYRTADSDLRAHRIALTYYNLAAHLDFLLNGRKKAQARQEVDSSVLLNANWFHFAMWGTLTVTQNLSTQRSPQRLNSGIPEPLRRRLTPAILRARATDGQRVGRALAWGQLAIFVSATQILFQVLGEDDELTGRTASKATDQKEITEAVLARLEGIGLLSTIKMDAVRYIVPMTKAFNYYKKSIDTSGVERAWLTLGANLGLTAAEQDLADVAVEVVLDHLPQHVGAAIDWRLAKLAERFRGVPPHLAYTLLESMHPGKREVIYTVWSRLMTDQVLVMALPTETLRLGRDIPPKHREWPIFPPDLRAFPDVSDDKDMRAIVNFVKSIDRTIADSGTRGSAARDWRRWDERMNWALALIRSRQQDETLFWSPYSVADQWNIVNGEMPTRVGDASTLDVQAPTAQILAPVVAHLEFDK